MKTNPTENTILAHVCYALGGASFHLAAGEPWAAALVELSSGAEYLPSFWLDRSLSDAERQAYSRACRRLEQRGRVVRVVSGGRVTHLQPTPRGLVDGIAAAADQFGEPVDLACLVIALGKAAWATPEHRAAVAAIQQQQPAATPAAQPTGEKENADLRR